MAPEVARVMQSYLCADGIFGNPSSLVHAHGRMAEAAVEAARAQVASLFRCSSQEVIFTSGATEADNAAIKGAAWGRRDSGRHIITMATEHKAVIESCKALQADGYEVSFLRPDHSGHLDLDLLRKTIRSDTILVSVMHVNNETGVVQDIASIGDIVAQSNAYFHVDAAQSAGKIPINLSDLPVDLLSISAHKFYGPKGVGALIKGRHRRMKLVPIIDGGGQEQGLRSGTLATHQIMGMGEAVRLAVERMRDDLSHVAALRAVFLGRLAGLSAIKINGDLEKSYPGIVSVSFPELDAFVLLNALPDVSASASSACSTGTLEPSHVLRAMGIEGDQLYGAVRFSFGRFTNEIAVAAAADRVVAEVSRLLALAAEPTAG